MVKHNAKAITNSHLSIADLRDITSGRWLEILVAAGIPRESLVGRAGRPCPRCGGHDRFAPMPDLEQRGAVLCRHCHNGSTEPRCGDGIATLGWWLGVSTGEVLDWLHGFLGLKRSWVPKRPPFERRLELSRPADSSLDWNVIARRYAQAMKPRWLRRAAELLGLPTEPLAQLQVGWNAQSRATTWPMRDTRGQAIGVRLRCPRTGRKWAERGSRAGLFFAPELLSNSPVECVWIAEGPTDTAAMISIGLKAVGVPSAGGGAELLRALGTKLRVGRWVVVADADGAGRTGAERLAESLLLVAPVRIITPVMVKDARAWVHAGASSATFWAEAERASERRLAMKGDLRD